MKHLGKIFLVLFVGILLAQCSTYKIKPDMSKNGVVNKTPDWYVEYKHETWRYYQEAATAVSPDMELAVKKATLLAKAKLVDRINGEMLDGSWSDGSVSISSYGCSDETACNYDSDATEDDGSCEYYYDCAGAVSYTHLTLPTKA